MTWQVSSVLGVFIGSGVPPEWSLDFAIPLVFMALLFPAVKDRGTRLAAVVAGLAAVALIGLPLNLGLLAAAMLGISAGVISEVTR
jgi:predicted branched-subunit amino acid permease